MGQKKILLSIKTVENQSGKPEKTSFHLPKLDNIDRATHKKKFISKKNYKKLRMAETTHQDWAKITHPLNRAETTQAETTWPKGDRTETTQGLNGNMSKTIRYRFLHFPICIIKKIVFPISSGMV